MDEPITHQLIFSILQFFDDQQRSPHLSPAAIESLEVATQCLESAYGVSVRDVEAAAVLQVPASLTELFAAGLLQLSVPEASVADKELGEKLKIEGNEFMKQEKYHEAADSYSSAIKLDGRNAVYYCNRAAAYGKIGEHEKSVIDCKRALEIDPRYCKAYARKGLAHTALGQQVEAHECFKKALEIDPVNEGYRDNLRRSEQSLHEESMNAATRGMNELGFGGGLDFSSLLNNPALMNMATSMLSNPQMQTMMANMMAGASGQSLGPSSMSSLLQAGQQLAQQMQQSNPELVEQLRSQMRAQSSSEASGSDTPKPDESEESKDI